MTDLALEWNDDFQIDSTGDLATVDGDDEVRQRLERRLFTAVQGYVWHPEYGAGLPQDIGKTLSVTQIQSICAAQLALEATVAPNPPAQLSVAASQGGVVTISIKYWDAASGVSVSFTITS
jgi:phage baseplate assembly protein W